MEAIKKLLDIEDKFNWLNQKSAFNARSQAEKQAIYIAVALGVIFDRFDGRED